VLLGEIRKGFVGTVKGDYCQGKLLDNSSLNLTHARSRAIK